MGSRPCGPRACVDAAKGRSLADSSTELNEMAMRAFLSMQSRVDCTRSAKTEARPPGYLLRALEIDSDRACDLAFGRTTASAFYASQRLAAGHACPYGVWAQPKGLP